MPAHNISDKTTCNNIKLNKSFKEYCLKLDNMDRKIFIKLSLMNKLDINLDAEPYLYLYKYQQRFYMETFVYVDINFKEAYPYIIDYASYNSWILNNFNTSRSGLKDMGFLEIDSIKHDREKELLTISSRLNFAIFKQKYDLFLKMKEYYDLDFAKKLHLKILEPTSLTPDIDGTFIFFEIPDKNYMILFFYGYAKLHSILYNLLPVKFMEIYTKEKVEILNENLRYKIEEIKEKKLNKELLILQNSSKANVSNKEKNKKKIRKK
jgi:hypothetical protein